MPYRGHRPPVAPPRQCAGCGGTGFFKGNTKCLGCQEAEDEAGSFENNNRGFNAMLEEERMGTISEKQNKLLDKAEQLAHKKETLSEYLRSINSFNKKLTSSNCKTVKETQLELNEVKTEIKQILDEINLLDAAKRLDCSVEGLKALIAVENDQWY